MAELQDDAAVFVDHDLNAAVEVHALHGLDGAFLLALVLQLGHHRGGHAGVGDDTGYLHAAALARAVSDHATARGMPASVHVHDTS